LGRATFFLGPLLQEVGSYWDASAAGKFCVVLDRRINTAVRVSIPEPCQACLGHCSINSTTRYAALAAARFKKIWGKA